VNKKDGRATEQREAKIEPQPLPLDGFLTVTQRGHSPRHLPVWETEFCGLRLTAFLAAHRRRNREILIADVGAPLQAFEMTTVSQDLETTAVRADWVVADAVRSNRSAWPKIPMRREKCGKIAEFDRFYNPISMAI
jgi:hypothetical protein